MTTAITEPTPGPWNYVLTNGSPTTGIHMISGATPGFLAEVRDCGSGDVHKNISLIVAAPELLDALKSAVELLEILSPLYGDVQRKAEKAIARAEGAA